MLAFDLDGKGKTDYLVVYDPGHGQIIIANYRNNDFVRASGWVLSKMNRWI